VHEVAVAGVPSEEWGEEVTAFVVPAGPGPLSEQELIAFARDRLASYKCPKRVITVEALPRNAMGKVQRSLLVK
jgi:acyl-CoA synthetase (AMP-forming)/AMP-acid ligase II